MQKRLHNLQSHQIGKYLPQFAIHLVLHRALYCSCCNTQPVRVHAVWKFQSPVPRGSVFSKGQTTYIYGTLSHYFKDNVHDCCSGILLFLRILYQSFTMRWRNYIHYKMWDEITYPGPDFTTVPLKFGMDKIFHITLCWASNYLCVPGLKSIHLGEKGPWYESNWIRHGRLAIDLAYKDQLW